MFTVFAPDNFAIPNQFRIFPSSYTLRGTGSSVGIATGYGLDSPGIEFRWEARFSAPLQTGPGGHAASCTMGTGSFPRVKSGRGVTLTTHPLLVPWPRKSRAIPLLTPWAYGLYRASVPVQGYMYFVHVSASTVDRV